MSGYKVTGNVNSTMPPANVITIDSTLAKIGRSIKKRENMIANASCYEVPCEDLSSSGE
jgi:hypothetical protein